MSDTRKLKNFEFGNATDTGRVREQNEDYLGYFETINGHVFVVCDGMGGHLGGSTASQLAVESVRSFLESHYFDFPQEALKAAIDAANDAVYRKAAENIHLKGMGTTIVLGIVRDDKFYYAHVGDSRIYIHSGNKICRLTSDHSYVQSLVDQGMLTEEEMETHPRKNEILEALGVKPETGMTISSVPVKPANTDTILLCTDGLNSMLSDNAIEAILNENISVQHKALKLIQSANDAGGYDNTTVQLVNFYNVSNKKSEFVAASARKKTEETEILSPKQFKMKRNIMIVVIGLAVLAILYFIWDMFIRSSAPAPLIETKTNDTVKTKTEDTVKPAAGNNASGNSVTNAIITSKTDTLWIAYTVKSGDVLGKISSKFHIGIDIIKKKNKLKNDNINKDQLLKLPVRAEYTVQNGDNLDMLAKRYNVSKEAVLKANGYSSDKELKAGKSIYIPF